LRICETQQFECAASRAVCRVKALGVSKQHGIQDFKASQGWMETIFVLEKGTNLSEWQKKKKQFLESTKL
jgi:hypothetical protein